MGNKTYLNGQKMGQDDFDRYFQVKGDVNDLRFGHGTVYQNKQDKDTNVLVVHVPSNRLIKHKKSSKNSHDEIYMQDMNNIEYLA